MHHIRYALTIVAVLLLPALKAEDWIAQTAHEILRQIHREAEQLQQLNQAIAAEKRQADACLNEHQQDLKEQTTHLQDERKLDSNLQQQLKEAQQRNAELKEAQDAIRTMAGNDLDAFLNKLRLQTQQDTLTLQRNVQVTTPDGTILTGTQATFGPYAFFCGDEPVSQSGILHQLPHQPFPQLFTHFTPEQQRQLQLLFQGKLATPPLDPSGGKALAVISQDESFCQHLRKGGIVMIPLGLIAVAALITVLVKACQFARLSPYLKQLEELGRNVSELPADQQEEQLFLTASKQAAKLERFLSTIAVCASAAPLLGLLGTVTGMIHTFSLITVYGTGDPRLLSAGISEALITTEVGLAIAIPALLAHVWLSRKFRRFKQRQQQTAIRIISRQTPSPHP